MPYIIAFLIVFPVCWACVYAAHVILYLPRLAVWYIRTHIHRTHTNKKDN